MDTADGSASSRRGAAATDGTEVDSARTRTTASRARTRATGVAAAQALVGAAQLLLLRRIQARALVGDLEHRAAVVEPRAQPHGALGRTVAH